MRECEPADFNFVQKFNEWGSNNGNDACNDNKYDNIGEIPHQESHCGRYEDQEKKFVFLIDFTHGKLILDKIR
jgi:hypothetical protein